VPAGSVILTSRAPVGNIAIADVPVATNQGCKALVPNLEKVSTEFLALTVRRLVPLMKVLSTGTTFQEISTGRLGAIKINVPTLPQQARMLDAVKAEVAPLLGAKQRVLSEIELILEYRDSLVAAVVTGRIDVRDAAIPVVEGDNFADDTATDADDLEDALDAVD
jgi:type I restriction enzyme S subunit